jgi:hypothetical protein
MQIEKLIELPMAKDDRTPARAQYEEWVARFCYAAAQLPPGTVAHFIDLMETCAESQSLKHTIHHGNA